MEIISAKYLLTMDSPVIFDGAIAVDGGEIVDVGTEEELIGRFDDSLREDFSHHVLMPGLINSHSHLDMTRHRDFPADPVRSLTTEVNFVDWLLSCIEYKKISSRETLRSAVEEGISSCLESGTTCVGDEGSYEGIFQSLEQCGLRAVVFPEVLSYDSQVAKDLFETSLAIIDKFAQSDSELITVGVAPYSPYTLSRNILRIMAQHCRSSNLPIMIHVSESFAEMEFFYNSTGDIATRLFPNIGWGDSLPPAFHKTPIAYLDDLGFLAARPILIGCVQATDGDLDRIAKNGAKVVWCPRSSHYLKLSQAPVSSMVNRGILVSLGSEGISSTNSLSMWDELRFAYETVRKRKEGIQAQDLLDMATCSAAKVLGVDGDVGTLSKGKKADYIVVDVADLPEKGDLYSFLIQNTKTYHIQKVVVNGQTIKTVN